MREPWQYSELSKAASAAGSPRQLLESTFQSGVTAGKSSMMPAVTIVGIIGTFVGSVLGFALRNYFDRKNVPTPQFSEDEIELANDYLRTSNASETVTLESLKERLDRLTESDKRLRAETLINDEVMDKLRSMPEYIDFIETAKDIIPETSERELARIYVDQESPFVEIESEN